MKIIKKGSNVLVPENGMVHRVTRVGEGQKTDGSYDFYAYHVACEEDAIHVAFDAEAPRETEKDLSCFACVAACLP